MGPAVELGLLVGIAVACAALGIARASFYRARRRLAPKVVANHPRPVPARALGATERAAVIEVLHQARFADLSVREVYAALLDDGRYLCSIATMYRLLRALGESRERRAQRQHPRYAMPRLVAAAPNQVWTWDITKLGGPVKWLYFSLYVVLDIFSRYVVSGRARKPRVGRTADHPKYGQAGCNARHADGSFRPRRADEGQAPRPAARRSGVYPQPQPAAGVQRQSLLGEPLQDAQVLPGLSPTVRFAGGRARFLPDVLRLVQPRASSHRAWAPDPPQRPLRLGRGASRRASDGA